MKVEEATLNGEKLSVVVDFDDSFIEMALVENDSKSNIEDTTDLSKTIEFIRDGIDE